MNWLIDTVTGTPKDFTLLDVLDHVRTAFLYRRDVFRAQVVLGLTPPCILSARTVATMTAASGFSPAFRHLMLKNFSAPRSAPKPASVTT